MSLNQRSYRRVAIITCLAILLSPISLPASSVSAAGSISLTLLGTAYTENFDTLASTGTSSTTPTGWEFLEAGANSNTLYTAGNGSGNTGDTYSYGSTSAPERAFGGLRSGNLLPIIGANFVNNTGGTITSLAVVYNGEQWRIGNVTAGRPADRWDFQLSLDAISLSTGIWTDYDNLDFSSPVITGAAAGALDGNTAPNRTAISFTIEGISIPYGSSFWIRWQDIDITGAEDGLSIDDFSLTPAGTPGDTPPSVSTSYPEDKAADFPVGADLSITFSEPVTAADGWFEITCDTSGAHTAAVSGGPLTFSLNPDIDFTDGEACSLTAFASLVTDTDLNDPPDAMAADFSITFTAVDVCKLSYTGIYAIQGSGPDAAITGPVTTQGIVVGDYEGGASPEMRGFYIQDASGDANPATSDAIFVYEGSGVDVVSLGDLVRVSGTAAEFQGQTQITADAATTCGTGSITPVDVTFPLPSADYLERYEGMLVRLPQTMFVTEHFQLGRFGQVVLSADARLQQPTNVVSPGPDALALQAANNLNRIILDDASQAQNPDPVAFARGGLPLSASNTLRGGDTAANIVGVMTYTWSGNAASGNAYRLRPLNALGGAVNFQPANPRPEPPNAVEGRQLVMSMNLLNYFNTFTGCTNGVGGAATDCRGANNQAEFDRQYPKLVAAIITWSPAVIGLTELENDGYGAESAIQDLVDRLNAAAGPGTYAFIDADALTGQENALGLDAIKVGILYRPAAVTPVGTTAALNSEAFVNGGDAVIRNRPALAQAFALNTTGARFVVAANHLKSKGSACDTPDAGDGQGNCSAVRATAAALLTTWLAGDPTGSGDPDTLILGDLNSYAREDPLTVIKAAGFTNLVDSFVGAGSYSYAFDGQWGSLDHALSSASLTSQVAGAGVWHINADEPSILDYNMEFKSPGQLVSLYAPDQYRSTDHDPLLIGLNLTVPVYIPLIMR